MPKLISLNWLAEFRDLRVYTEQLGRVVVKLCVERARDFKRFLEEAEELKKPRNTEHPWYLLNCFSFSAVGSSPQLPNSVVIAEKCDLSCPCCCFVPFAYIRARTGKVWYLPAGSGHPWSQCTRPGVLTKRARQHHAGWTFLQSLHNWFRQ